MYKIICQHCGEWFRWDGLGTHDECPHCTRQVDCRTRFASKEDMSDYAYYKKIDVNRLAFIENTKDEN